MKSSFISHSELANFAVEKINLPKDKASVYRAQVRGLREKLEAYLKEHPDFTLRKILLSGSLAKGTALRSINDIDVACYISGAEAPSEISELINYLAARLRMAYPNFSPDQVTPQTYSVKVSFRGTGLDIDIVPILYYEDPDWYGNLVSQQDGSFLKTCIPRHIEFIKKRKKEHEYDFSQVVRIAKYWVRYMKQEREGFRFKSFMVELILAKLADDGLDLSDYVEALQHFFTYIVQSDIREQIAFSDYYSISSIPHFTEPVRMIDPVNAENNASKLYSNNQADSIVNAALDAGDAIDAAILAPTKGKALYYWQKVFGPTFQVKYHE